MADAVNATLLAAENATQQAATMAANATHALGRLDRTVQPLADAPDINIWGTALTTAGGLLLVLALLLFGFWVIRRFGPQGLASTGPGQGNRLISRMPISTKHSICVVQVEGKRLVLGVSEHNVNLLTELDNPGTEEEADIAPQAQTPFSQTLKRFLGKSEKDD